jgi:Holliday junction DNA helicase RuvA
MIAYIKGLITTKTPTFVVIETSGGVAYHIHISLHTYAKIEKLEQAKLLTVLIVREDAHLLYGFNDGLERNIFQQLISVSGIGPNTAQLMLSSMTPEAIRAAILGENERTLSGIKGIGPKTAKRLIIELKDKLIKDGGDNDFSIASGAPNTNQQQLFDETLFALTTLGFLKIKAQKVLTDLLNEKRDTPYTVEALVKEGIRKLSS